jgi:hypothetical protein
MADDPNVVPKSAIFQSVTTEAGGFYTTVTTVASTFLAASLLFVEKWLVAGTVLTIMFLAVSWIALVTSIVCVARVRFLNLKSGQLALVEKFDAAEVIDVQSWKFSTMAQWSLIVGMAALVLVGLVNVTNLGKKENANVNNNSGNPQPIERTIPFGSLNKPATTPAQAPTPAPSQTPGSTPTPTNPPNK